MDEMNWKVVVNFDFGEQKRTSTEAMFKWSGDAAEFAAGEVGHQRKWSDGKAKSVQIIHVYTGEVRKTLDVYPDE